MYAEDTGTDKVEVAPEKGSDDMFSQQENIDYLDIPSFLRIQAD